MKVKDFKDKENGDEWDLAAFINRYCKITRCMPR